MKKQQLNCKILEHKEVIKDNFYLTMEWPDAINIFRPAQFVEVETTKNIDPILRRPFSVMDATESSITIAYKKLGKGTTELSKRKVGETINIIGPLGNFYPTHQIKENQKQNIIIVGGGTGIASVHYLAKYLDFQKMDYKLIVGFRSNSDIFCKEELGKLKGKVMVFTNDGSYGEKGFVTNADFNSENSIIFACGPTPMTLALREKIGDNLNFFASLEEYMGCGLGLCNGCVVKVKAENIDGFEYKRVCKNGPVFNVKDVIWAI